jgi:hypothetical protein
MSKCTYKYSITGDFTTECSQPPPKVETFSGSPLYSDISIQDQHLDIESFGSFTELTPYIKTQVLEKCDKWNNNRNCGCTTTIEKVYCNEIIDNNFTEKVAVFKNVQEAIKNTNDKKIKKLARIDYNFLSNTDKKYFRNFIDPLLVSYPNAANIIENNPWILLQI